MIKYIAIAVIILIIFLTGFNCGKNAVEKSIYWAHDSIPTHWTDKDSADHAVQNVILVPTGGYIADPVGASKGGTISSKTEIGIKYKVPCPATRTRIDTLYSTDSTVVLDTVYSVNVRTDTIQFSDKIGVLHYWKKNQLLVDVISEKGYVNDVKAVAVYKEPLPIAVGPSVTTFYMDGKVKFLPGISLTYDLLRVFRKRR